MSKSREVVQTIVNRLGLPGVDDRFTGHMSAFTPMLADPASPDSNSAIPLSDDPASARLMHLVEAATGPQLYAGNPFRCLGVPTLEGPRDVARRLEEFQPGTKRAKPASEWAFAPRTPLTPEQARRMAEEIQDGGARLLAELFWFWPGNYPQESSDPAIDALAKGDVEQAYTFWLAAAAKGSPVAEHNMAVMFHYAALDREIDAGPLDEEALSWWHAAGQHWGRALAADELWSRLAARVKRLEDPAVPAGAVGELRACLSGVVANVQAVAAVARTDRGDDHAAAALVSLLRRSSVPADQAERACERALAAKGRTLERAIEQCEERITGEDGPCLRHVEELLRSTQGERRVIELVAGSDARLVRRLVSRLVEVATAGVHEHHRRTGDVRPGLPVLMALATFPANTEVRRKVTEQRIAVFNQAVTLALGGTPSADSAARLDAMLGVFADVLAPALEQFAWDPRLQSACRGRLIAELRELAHDACRELGDFDVSTRAFGLATELADEEARPAVMRERKQLWQQFQRAQEGAVQIEHNGCLVEIDARRMTCNGRTLAVEALTGIRCGITDTLSGRGPRVAWCAARDAVELDGANLFDLTEGAGERYRQVVAALDACVVPALADRMVRKVRSGQSIVLGQSALRPEGFVFQRRPGQGSGVETVPYAQLNQSLVDGALVIEKAGEPTSAIRYPLAEVWNAVLMGDVLSRLAALE